MTIFHLHLVSDATGETINSVARAGLAQFEGVSVTQHVWSLIRSPRQLEMVMDFIKQKPGLVLYTFVDEELRKTLENFIRAENVSAVPLLDPVLQAMASYFGIPSMHRPGRQHNLDADYFARIDAMDYALGQDDGNGSDYLKEADVIVLGVSRTSKTPTCIYLANRGIRAANIPLIPNQPLTIDLKSLKKPLLIGLVADPERLVAIRQNRLHLLHQRDDTAYTDFEQVRDELRQARRLFAQLECDVIDVTRRSIEETAAEIITLLSRKRMDDVKP